MADLFGVKTETPEQKPESFELRSSKGSKVKIVYAPSGAVKVTDKKAFEKHLLKVVDLFEVKEKAPIVEKKEPKDLDIESEAKND